MRAGFVLRNLKNMLLASFSTINVAELRTYDWDGVFERAEWHGWCDLFGAPYRVLFNQGEQIVEGGWIDVIHLARLPITAKITAGAGVAGAAILRFEGAQSLYDDIIRDIPSDMEMIADVNGVTETETHGVIDVGIWNYIRFNSVINNASGPINLRIVTHDGVRPIQLPAGTGV